MTAGDAFLLGIGIGFGMCMIALMAVGVFG